jgi:hypothetical protein
MTKKSLVNKKDKLLVGLEKEKKKSLKFSKLLSDLNNIDSKRKALWIEIYDNAVEDREKASMLFTEAYKSMGTSNSINDHTTLGVILTKYLERMSKSNDQILDLANLILKVEEKEQKVDPDALFDKIQEMTEN